MTPCIDQVDKAKLAYKIHQYEHDANESSYGEEAAKKMGVEAQRVFKTLVVNLEGKGLAVGIVPVDSMLNMKRMAKAAGVKKATMATAQEVERSTGYVLGGVSPLGQKKRLKTIIHLSAEHFDTIFVSAGRRGLEIELEPCDLKLLTNGDFADICQ